MTKEKSIKFLQSWIDKVKNASEEDIAFYKHRLEEDSKIRKSILVVDTPETCLDCMFCFELDEGINACCSVISDENDKGLCRDIECDGGYCQNKPDWCPLKELPEEESNDYCYDLWERGWNTGWNEYLKVILGENNNV